MRSGPEAQSDNFLHDLDVDFDPQLWPPIDDDRGDVHLGGGGVQRPVHALLYTVCHSALSGRIVGGWRLHHGFRGLWVLNNKNNIIVNIIFQSISNIHIAMNVWKTFQSISNIHIAMNVWKIETNAERRHAS